MKKYLLSLLTLLLGANLYAQSNDEIIFKAMQDEAMRSLNELQVENVQKPSFVSYALFDGRTLNIQSSLGATIQIDERPLRNHGVQLLIGDYSCTSDCDYNGRYLSNKSAVETDYGQIRRELWFTTDLLYKNKSTDLAGKTSLRKQRIMSPEEAALPDFVTIEPIVKSVEGYEFDMNRTEWEKKVNELSAIFQNYPKLYDSKVELDINDFNYYLVTSEGTVVKQPMNVAFIGASASVRTEEGTEYTDQFRLYVPTDLAFPSMDELKKKVDEFAKNLTAFAEAPVIDEFYSGPVLFLDETVMPMFTKNLLTSEGLLTQRKAEDINSMIGLFWGDMAGSKKTLEYRIGQRVLDSRLTVKHTPFLKEYDGVKLMGHYEVDAEGVVPAEELVLIDTGIMCTMLNGRIPTLKSPNTTGSQRFAIDEDVIATSVAPGVLRVDVNGGQTREELEAQLIKLAKADNMKYAYIVTRMNGNINLLYKVDVNTGEKTLVRKADITPVSLGQLKKIAGISNHAIASNFMVKGAIPASIIYPDAILLENVEISEFDTTQDKVSPLQNPLERDGAN